MEQKIDFVLIWVDGSDEKWRKERNKYSEDKAGDNREVRFRDWDNLYYWFRGVEKFAPWVNNIYFVTWGHLPIWLNTNHPKLKIINHKDFIPKEYLPTFNSHTIELNLHRIEGLSEKFVYFNDDTFITSEVKPEDFFKEELPCDTFAQDAIFFGKDSVGLINGAIMTVINSNFPKKAALKKSFLKWYNPVNGLRNLVKTTLLMPWPWFPGFFYQHTANAFLKSTFTEVWDKEYEVLDKTCRDKFRQQTNVNQWLMKFWQLASGKFIPRSPKLGHCYHVKDVNFDKTCEAVEKGRHSIICINDTANTENFEEKAEKVREAFSKLLPDKSKFER